MAQVFSCEFSEIFQNTFFYRTPLLAFSVNPLTTPEKDFPFTTKSLPNKATKKHLKKDILRKVKYT